MLFRSYSEFATKVYGRTITKADATERFVGKTCTLGLGYGTGWEKLQHTLKTQPPCAVLDDLEYFHVSNAAPEQDQYNMGIERVGTLAGRYQVYRDPYFPPNQVLIGHKGTSLLDTGYIYAPYVPLQLTPTMYNPFNFTPIKGIMTRYAKKMVNNRFYGRITVDGVRTFDLKELR